VRGCEAARGGGRLLPHQNAGDLSVLHGQDARGARLSRPHPGPYVEHDEGAINGSRLAVGCGGSRRARGMSARLGIQGKTG